MAYPVAAMRGDVAVGVVDREHAVDGNEAGARGRAIDAKEPATIVLAREHLDPRLALGAEDVLAEGGDRPIAGELLAAVVRLARVGKHLDDHGRVQEGVPCVVLELRPPAHDRSIGVDVALARRDPDAHVRVERDAAAVGEERAKQRHDGRSDRAVLERSGGHREDHAVRVLVLLLRGAFRTRGTLRGPAFLWV
jgi:hypothetical protein